MINCALDKSIIMKYLIKDKKLVNLGQNHAICYNIKGNILWRATTLAISEHNPNIGLIELVREGLKKIKK